MKKFNYIIFLIIALAAVSLQAKTIENVIHEELQNFFGRQLSVQPENVEIAFTRNIDLPKLDAGTHDIQVSARRSSFKPGKQTVWVEIRNGSLAIVKLPVTVDVSVYRDVLSATRSISRNEVLTPDKFRSERRRFASSMDGLICDSELLSGAAASRSIREGTIITDRMIKKVPAVFAGDVVEVRVPAGALVISTEAVAQREGAIGDEISVQCSATGRKLRAVVREKGVVVTEK